VSGRNPDLPILDELGAEFATLVAATVAVERGTGDGGFEERPLPAGHTARRRAPAAASRARRERGAQARRISRRAAIVLVLICLVGGVAFAALRGGGSGDHAHATPALLGRDPGGAWSFSAYRDGSRLCTVFVPRGGELSGSCAPAPEAGRLRAGSAIVAGRRYVFGVAGAGVARASISLPEGGPAHPGATAGVHPPVDRDAAGEAGIPPADAWFVADLGPVRRGSRLAAPAVVIPLTRHGHRSGPPYVDCSLGDLARACVRRIRSAAGG
jgi:hypothetical protein